MVQCLMCSSPATCLCGTCHGQLYCGPKCQRLDWPAHRAVCKSIASIAQPRVENAALIALLRRLQGADVDALVRGGVIAPLLALFAAPGAESEPAGAALMQLSADYRFINALTASGVIDIALTAVDSARSSLQEIACAIISNFLILGSLSVRHSMHAARLFPRLAATFEHMSANTRSGFAIMCYILATDPEFEPDIREPLIIDCLIRLIPSRTALCVLEAVGKDAARALCRLRNADIVRYMESDPIANFLIMFILNVDPPRARAFGNTPGCLQVLLRYAAAHHCKYSIAALAAICDHDQAFAVAAYREGALRVLLPPITTSPLHIEVLALGAIARHVDAALPMIMDNGAMDVVRQLLAIGRDDATLAAMRLLAGIGRSAAVRALPLLPRLVAEQEYGAAPLAVLVSADAAFRAALAAYEPVYVALAAYFERSEPAHHLCACIILSNIAPFNTASARPLTAALQRAAADLPECAQFAEVALAAMCAGSV